MDYPRYGGYGLARNYMAGMLSSRSTMFDVINHVMIVQVIDSDRPNIWEGWDLVISISNLL